MRPYIIINGVPSTRIEGLIISTLPSISKPEIRTDTETIDGRDGDIVTKLGYSAYDKSFTIGLSYNYDIDEVISYFNSSGKIIFSNEPDKYYNFMLTDAIDFDKLMRFKTANLSVHVQPFKYSAVETKQTFTFDEEATSGSLNIRNSGNYFSKPLITITGSGTTNIYLNDKQVLVINLGSNTSTIIIDIDSMNAYDPTNSNLLNRNVIGDYNNCVLDVGKNTIGFVGGTIESIAIDRYSRWI